MVTAEYSDSPTFPSYPLPTLLSNTTSRSSTPFTAIPLVPPPPPPVLLNVLGAGDDESILVLVVEEDEEEEGEAREEGEAAGIRNGSETIGISFKDRSRVENAVYGNGEGNKLDGERTNDQDEPTELDSSEKLKRKRAGRVYAGSQGGDIHVWDLPTLSPLDKLSGHTGAILALVLVRKQDWLISSSGDGTIRVWHTPTLHPLYLIHPLHDNVGDIFSLVWVDHDLLEGGGRGETSLDDRRKKTHGKGRGRLFAGGQDTSIQWIDLPPTFTLPTTHPPASPPLLHYLHERTSSSHSLSNSPPITRAPNKFFDSMTLADRPPLYSTVSSGGTTSSSGGFGKKLLSAGAGVVGGNQPASTSNLSRSLLERSRPSLPSTPTQLPIPTQSLNRLPPVGTATQSRNIVGGALLMPRRTSDPESPRLGAGTGRGGEMEHVVQLQFEEGKVVNYAHFGYLYCLHLGKSNDRNILVSGSGDELIKLWTMQQDSLSLLATLESQSDAVLALDVLENTAFAGHQGGVIKIWDLDTLTCIRSLSPHTSDILTLTIINRDFYTGSSDGQLQKWDKRFNVVNTWKGHDSIVLSSVGSCTGGMHLITGGNDAVIKIWDIEDTEKIVSIGAPSGGFQGQMFHSLSKLVSYKTIADEEHREECRQGALYLKRVLRQLGAETFLLPGSVDKNPIVLATFKANAPPSSSSPLNSSKKRKRVLCYGHYDVVGAHAGDTKWSHDPFEMTGKNGWIYGRGVSDNKGPMLAVAAAASDLRSKQALDVDFVMVVEGEEETGSAGFQEAIRKNRDLIGDIDCILVSNSYWIGEDIPCLTFGLRGVIHATVGITSDQPDLHSGMQGGVVSEPLVDMVRLLASLTDADGKVRIPGFLNDVSKLGEKESELYEEIIKRSRGNGTEDKLPQHSHIPDPMQSLVTRWRQPALSIHKVEVASAAQKTLIPSWATSSLSIRIVPDQPLAVIIERLTAHLNNAFASLNTHNKLHVDVNHVAKWWLGDIENPFFKAFAECIETEWNIRPLFIREGGSIPSLPFLEHEFNAPAILYPMGLGSDHAHLPDERIPIINLERGKTIVSNWLRAISKLE